MRPREARGLTEQSEGGSRARRQAAGMPERAFIFKPAWREDGRRAQRAVVVFEAREARSMPLFHRKRCNNVRSMNSVGH